MVKLNELHHSANSKRNPRDKLCLSHPLEGVRGGRSRGEVGKPAGMTRTSEARTRNKAGPGTEASGERPPGVEIFFTPMPIVNGTYVPDTLGTAKSAQKQVFGEYSRNDMADYTQAAYNYLMKQQEQAYNLQLWNMTNEYNSPAAQMQRFQDAGLNPFLIYQQQNTAQSPASASAANFRSSGNMGKSIASGISAIQQILGMVKSARETYDYMKYGAETSRWNMINAQESVLGHKMENAWLDWKLHGENMIYGDASRLPYGPAAQAFQQDYAYRGAQIRQVAQIIKHYAKTDERFDKLIELDDQRLGQMKAQYDWILTGFHTGNETLDQFLRMLMMFALQGNL